MGIFSPGICLMQDGAWVDANLMDSPTTGEGNKCFLVVPGPVHDITQLKQVFHCLDFESGWASI